MKFKNKEQVRDYLKNSKIYVDGQSEEIQKVLFEYGFDRKYETLEDGEIIVDEVGDTHNPFIFIINRIFFTSCDMDYFHNYSLKKLKAEDILSIEIEDCEFETFDKVLMYINGYWKPQLFGYRDSSHVYHSIEGLESFHCIFYKGNEHLTNESVLSTET